eukprot:1397640-Prymnesium_polylepis.1
MEGAAEAARGGAEAEEAEPKGEAKGEAEEAEAKGEAKGEAEAEEVRTFGARPQRDVRCAADLP